MIEGSGNERKHAEDANLMTGSGCIPLLQNDLPEPMKFRIKVFLVNKESRISSLTTSNFCKGLVALARFKI